MKKKIDLLKILFFIFSFASLITSCQKETPRKPFKAQIKTWYRISPTAPAPLVVNGTTYIGFAHFPGGGTGNATHMGNVTSYFNQLAYTTAPEAPPAGSVAAPVADVPGYPVLGGPLPLIQAGDFSGLAATVSALQIPASVQGKIINSIFVNKKGDAVFTSAITGSGSTFPISETVVGFNGKALIVGGRGKFANAVGEVDYEGYLNTRNANDAEYNVDGWISY